MVWFGDSKSYGRRILPSQTINSPSAPAKIEGYNMANDLEFYRTYNGIDIWMSLNTKTGITTYSLWWKGVTYERTNPYQIINLAKKLEKQR